MATGAMLWGGAAYNNGIAPLKNYMFGEAYTRDGKTLVTASHDERLPRVRDAATAKAISRVADAVVIGSRLIQLIENEPADRVNTVAAEFLSGIRLALDA